MFNSFEQKSGSIAFIKRDSNATAKELFFEDAYAVKYNEYFHAVGRGPMSTKVTISSRIIAIGHGEHENEWV